jgi:hypothetical protein
MIATRIRPPPPACLRLGASAAAIVEAAYGAGALQRRRVVPARLDLLPVDERTRARLATAACAVCVCVCVGGGT